MKKLLIILLFLSVNCFGQAKRFIFEDEAKTNFVPVDGSVSVSQTVFSDNTSFNSGRLTWHTNLYWNSSMTSGEMQNIINSLPKYGGRVYSIIINLAAGNYTLTNRLDFNCFDNIQILGAYSNNPQTNGTVLTFSNPSSEGMFFSYSGQEMIVFLQSFTVKYYSGAVGNCGIKFGPSSRGRVYYIMVEELDTNKIGNGIFVDYYSTVDLYLCAFKNMAVGVNIGNGSHACINTCLGVSTYPNYGCIIGAGGLLTGASTQISGATNNLISYGGVIGY